ncbi:hypothetical protein BV22DRAFT_1123760 [Leucogyrophana mollusca]|uniref:Uncharacterized protein n=1 Tax=Leucogyrophana mollusca TaxID=85980 RepID=A0ACB8AXV6_9AGAM|nr:hypothetical protein BV22DRAFT_1123760 [Leucogyrophana mollusca]
MPELLFCRKSENPMAALRKPRGIVGTEGSYTLLSKGLHLSSSYPTPNSWHRNLWKGGIYHREVSTSNLMYSKVASRRPAGVPTNLDLCTSEINGGPSGNQRAGTEYSHAAEGLAGKIKHLYRYEVESFIWVLDAAFSLPATATNTVIEALRKRAFGPPDDVVFDEFKSPAEKHKPRQKRFLGWGARCEGVGMVKDSLAKWSCKVVHLERKAA